MNKRHYTTAGAIAIFLCFLLAPTGVQGQWSWPDKTENMQVLPKDWSGRRLAPVMQGFSKSLGVRCIYCHVGKQGAPLSEIDFVSDDNPNKDRTREMLRMLESINEHLDYVDVSGDKPVNMWCHTCHRGRPRPMTLAEEMGEAYRADGSSAAITRYEDLKKKYYGKGAYNFESENTLNDFGYEVLGKEDVKGALDVFALNAEKYPKSGNVWDSLAEAYMKSGDNDMAKKYYQKSLDLDPRNQNATDMLKKLNE